jgi:hypothetical protein
LLSSVMSSVLGSSSTGMIVPLHMSWPEELAEGQSGSVSVELWNLGGENVENLGLSLDVGPTQLAVLDDANRTVSTIVPGGMQLVTWTIQPLGTAVADTDSVAFVPITLRPDSATAGAMLGAGRLIAVTQRAGASVGAEAVSGQLRIQPNPSRGSVTFLLPVEAGAVADCTVYDVAGRLCWKTKVRSPSTRRAEVVWNGRLTSGAMANAGTYFVKVRSGNHEWKRALVLLK